jgi:mRNA interferase HigB
LHVISQKPLREFAKNYPDAATPLKAWFKLAKTGQFRNLIELNTVFGSVDMVPIRRQQKSIDYYVFDIGGNKYRLIAAVHFNTQMIFVRNVLTHQDYDQGRWKK